MARPFDDVYTPGFEYASTDLRTAAVSPRIRGGFQRDRLGFTACRPLSSKLQITQPDLTNSGNCDLAEGQKSMWLYVCSLSRYDARTEFLPVLFPGALSINYTSPCRAAAAAAAAAPLTYSQFAVDVVLSPRGRAWPHRWTSARSDTDGVSETNLLGYEIASFCRRQVDRLIGELRRLSECIRGP